MAVISDQAAQAPRIATPATSRLTSSASRPSADVVPLEPTVSPAPVAPDPDGPRRPAGSGRATGAPAHRNGRSADWGRPGARLCGNVAAPVRRAGRGPRHRAVGGKVTRRTLRG
ncbi:hypothetical protein GCM10010377_32110 [Streptomyces viridiviolaceus]|nr:hypothetical protein GCM10010377_32110 [Streptomyces viridiviolaceus]